MSRSERMAASVVFALAGLAQTPAQRPPDSQLPPEEDAVEAPKEYVFNPVQSKREVEVGLLRSEERRVGKEC